MHILSIVDLNVPLANSAESVGELCNAVQFTNDLNPTMHACILEMVEQAKKTSKRGLADEEREVETALWGLRQSLDLRWVMAFDFHPQAESQTVRRLESGDLSTDSIFVPTAFTIFTLGSKPILCT